MRGGRRQRCTHRGKPDTLSTVNRKVCGEQITEALQSWLQLAERAIGRRQDFYDCSTHVIESVTLLWIRRDQEPSNGQEHPKEEQDNEEG